MDSTGSRGSRVSFSSSDGEGIGDEPKLSRAVFTTRGTKVSLGGGPRRMTKAEQVAMHALSMNNVSGRPEGRGGQRLPEIRSDGRKVKKDLVSNHKYGGGDTDNYFTTMKCYLAHSDTITKYRSAMIARANEVERRENLYAIVLPGGHGKTYLSERHGMIDVDSLTGGEMESRLYMMRRELVRTNSVEWNEHNFAWYSLLDKALTMMTFEVPTVVLVHSEECALELGAQIIGVFALNKAEFEMNISNRGEGGALFSRVSREFVINRSMNPVVMCDNNKEIEASVIATCNVNGIPVPAPYKYTKMYKNRWFSEDVPDWLLRGNVRGRRSETDFVLNLAKSGKIPKCCVDSFVAANSPSGRAYGYGVTMNDWAGFFGDVVGSMRDWPERFDFDGDMFAIFPPESEAEKNRVNVTMRRLLAEEYFWDDEVCQLIGEYHVGDRHVFVTSLISHWLGIGRSLPMAEKIGPLYFVSFENWSEVLGQFHNLIRLSDWYCTTPITEPERQSLMYMNMLTGRQMYVADWAKVVEERKESNFRKFLSFDPYRKLWTRSQYLEDFEVALSEGYSRMHRNPKKVDVSNFVQFWRRRRSWIAKGSTVLNQLPKDMLNYTISFMDGLCETIQMRHTKKSLFENHEILSLIKETEETWNATKVVPKLNETGKKRELLPGTLMHYLVFSYVLFVAEKQPRVGSTRLNVNDDENWAYYDRKMEKGLHHMLYDWANFNAQHSRDDMARVIEKLAEIPGVPEDYGFFCRAIAESFYHMYVIDPEGGKHEIDRGLYSGWRGTTWINTVLNFVYVCIGVKCCERIYNDFDPVYFDHGGDDLDVGFRSAQDCYRMIDVMNAIGYEAKDIKQMIAQKAEFYRCTVTERGVFASPTRALANFVSGNWESGGAKTLVEKTASILDQVAKLQRRGVSAEFCAILNKVALKHWLKIKAEDEWFELKDELLHAKCEFGGLGIPDWEGKLWVVDPPFKTVLESGVNVKLPGVYCSDDHVKVVEEELDRLGLRIVDRVGLVNKLAKQSYDLKGIEERLLFMEANQQKVEVVDKELAIECKWDDNLMKRFFRWVSSDEDKIGLQLLESLKELIGHVYHGDKKLTMGDLMRIYAGGIISDKVMNFRGNMYYRRLLPDFISASIEKFVLWSGDKEELDEEEMQDAFCTLCYMCSVLYDHRA